MILDGRDGAYGMTYKKVVTGTLPSSLLNACKRSVFLTDSSFDEKAQDVLYNAIHIFEKNTATTVLQSTITLNYEYFKGKNKLPFVPHTLVTPIIDFVLSGIPSVKYLEGGDGSEVSISFTAGYTVLPFEIQAVLVKIFECLWHNETGNLASNPYLFSLIKAHAVEMY